MGWDYQKTAADTETVIRRELERGGYAVRHYHRKGSAAYVAFTQPDGVTTTAVVVLVNRRGGALGLKWMHETEGPHYHDAPAELLDALSPLDRGYAQQWRARCREQIANRRPVLAGAAYVELFTA